MGWHFIQLFIVTPHLINQISRLTLVLSMTIRSQYNDFTSCISRMCVMMNQHRSDPIRLTAVAMRTYAYLFLLYVHAVDYPILYLGARVWLWIGLLAIYCVLLLVAFGLLLHLLIFHIYLRTPFKVLTRYNNAGTVWHCLLKIETQCT